MRWRMRLLAFGYTPLVPVSLSNRDSTIQMRYSVMRTCTLVALGLVVAAASAGCAQQAGTLQAAAGALKAADIRTIEYTGTGKWYQFGQAPSPTQQWPPFDVSAYTASINYDVPAAR